MSSAACAGPPPPASRTSRAERARRRYARTRATPSPRRPSSRRPPSPRTAPLGTVEQPAPADHRQRSRASTTRSRSGSPCARPEIDLLAVTTVGGNADVRHCTTNALRLLHLYGARRRAGRGGLGGRALRSTSSGRPEIHGEAGIGSTVLPAVAAAARPEGAVDLIAAILRAHPEPVVIAPIGPLTNIALLLRLHPELAPRIAHICLMGGSIGDGNTTVSAEFNIYADPEAAAIVFESGLPITMMGLDVTHQAVLYPPASERLRGARARAPARSPRSSPTTPSSARASGTARRGCRSTTRSPSRTSRSRTSSTSPTYNVQVDTGNGPARGRTVCDGLPRARRARRAARSNAQVGIRDRPRPVRGRPRRRLRAPAVGSRRRLARRAGAALAPRGRPRGACGGRLCATASARDARAPTPGRRPATPTPALRYVALGDSYTIGTSVAEAERWPDQLVGAAARSWSSSRTSASTASPRATSSRSSCRSSPRLRPGARQPPDRRERRRPGRAEATYRANVVRILDELVGLVGADRVLVVTTPDYTVTPAGARLRRPREQAAGDPRATTRSSRSSRRRAASRSSTSTTSRSARRPIAASSPSDGLHPSGAQYALLGRSDRAGRGAAARPMSEP